ncbi:MAG: phosphotransferase [Chloroflexi bacterium]|nr:phosphotransferase [Chloroflexota bacterium]
MSGAGAAFRSEQPETDADAVALVCRQAWGLTRVDVVDRPAPDAGSTALYRVMSAEGSFLLKEHSAAHASEDVERGARTATFLAARGFPTVAFRETRHGTLTAHTGGRLYSLRAWVEGQVLERQDITASHAARLGAVLGWCHRLLAELPSADAFDWSSVPTRVVQESSPARVAQELAHLAARIQARPERVATDELVMEAIALRRGLLERAEDLDSLHGPCPFQVVHGDYHRGNVIWSSDGALAGVIDVEGYTQHRVREIYRAISFFQRRVYPAAINFHFAQTFVRGYLQEAPLGPEELRQGPSLLRWRLLSGMTNFRAYIDNPHDHAIVKRIAWDQGLIRWLAEHGHELGEELARAVRPRTV